jgi:diguanylate cyclase (GGDEF)-like protein
VSKLTARLTAHLVVLEAMFAISLLVVAGAGAWGLGQTRAGADSLYSDHLRTTEATANLGQEIDDAYETAQGLLLASNAAERDQLTTTLLSDEIPTVEVALADLQVLHAGDPARERALVQSLVAGWAQFRAMWNTGSLLAAAPDQTAVESRLRAVFDPVETVTDQLLAIEQHDAGEAHRRADRDQQTSEALIAGVTAAALLMGIGFVWFVVHRVIPLSMAPEEAQAEFTEAMQLARSEAEAQVLLKRHLERALPGTSAVVLARDDASGRVTAATPLAPDSPLVESLAAAAPRSCTAIRTSRPHAAEPAREPLISCDVCQGCSERSLCTPLTVGGQIIGSVLVSRNDPLDGDDERRIRDSIIQAAPVLANLRNLAMAERQAATDSLTGLPNKRAIGDDLRRAAAEAARTLAPLAVLAIDLDHFKQVNDTFGHGRGDEVLAAVGGAIRSVCRASDIAGRNGGEEFLMLLPATDQVGAVVLAEKVRAAISHIYVSDDKYLTASIGVAALPAHATDAAGLDRAADRALYAAKDNGRDRVEVATTPSEGADATGLLGPPAEAATR